jgi:hypothetical protein
VGVWRGGNNSGTKSRWQAKKRDRRKPFRNPEPSTLSGDWCRCSALAGSMFTQSHVLPAGLRQKSDGMPLKDEQARACTTSLPLKMAKCPLWGAKRRENCAVTRVPLMTQ